MTQKPVTLVVPDHWPLVHWNPGEVRMPCPLPGCGEFTLYRRAGGTLDCTGCGASDTKVIQQAFNDFIERSKREQIARERAHAEAEEVRRIQIRNSIYGKKVA